LFLEDWESSGMIAIGETLRRERLRRNLDLKQISDELKLSMRFLEAIESERFDRLPGGVFTRRSRAPGRTAGRRIPDRDQDPALGIRFSSSAGGLLGSCQR
jgi:hypothetical protein